MDRKELRQPDQFITGTTSAVEWARKHGKTVAMGVGAAVAILLGIGFFNSYQAAQKRESNADLASALASFRAGDFEAAKTQLEAVSTQWSDLSIGPLAAVLAGSSALRSGDADEALEALGGVPTADLPPYLKQQRDFVLGAASEAKGDWAAAIEKYAAAAAADGPYTGDALVAQARSKAEAGDSGAAAIIYKKVLDEFPKRFDRDLISAQAG